MANERSLLRLLVLFAVVVAALPIRPAAAEVLRGMQVDPAISPADIDDLVGWKVNVVRYPLHWVDFAASDGATRESYMAWLESALATFEQILPRFKERKIGVILNLYTPPGGFIRRDNRSTHRLFTESWAQQSFLDAWQMIATRYVSESGILGYDLLNEPAQFSRPTPPLNDWNVLSTRAISIIRSIDRERTIYVSSVYGNPKRLRQLPTYREFSNISFTFHFYHPFKFLHQGVYGIKSGIQYPSKAANRSHITQGLKPAIQFARQRRADIYLGEFSTPRVAPKEGGFRYLRDLLPIIERNGWSWTFHAYRESPHWDVERGASTLNSSRQATTNRKELLLRYFEKNRAP